MDDTERKLLMLVAMNPRIHSQELADSLGISRQTVQEHMRVLKDKGIFEGMIASLSEYYLNTTLVLVFGKSNAESIDEVLGKLAESDQTHGVTVAGGNYLYVRGLLRSVNELDDYVRFAKLVAEIPVPSVGLIRFGAGIMPDYVDGVGRRESYTELTPLDFKILSSLQHNVRKPTAEIAREVGVSVKTVKRHLDRMISEGSIDFYVPFDLPPGEDMFTLIHVNLREGADNVKVGRRIFSRYPTLTLYVRSFSNLPNLLLCVLCSDKMTEIRKVLGLIAEDEDVLSVIPNLLYHEHVYTTWRDKLPEVEAALSSGAVRTRKQRSRLRRN